MSPLGRARPVRVWIPEPVVADVDDEAQRRGMTRSSAIVDALLGWLEDSVQQPSYEPEE